MIETSWKVGTSAYTTAGRRKTSPQADADRARGRTLHTHTTPSQTPEGCRCRSLFHKALTGMTRRKLAGPFKLTAVPFRARIGPRITPRHPKPQDHGHVPDQGETGESGGRVNACPMWRARTPPPDTSHSSRSGPDKNMVRLPQREERCFMQTSFPSTLHRASRGDEQRPRHKINGRSVDFFRTSTRDTGSPSPVRIRALPSRAAE